MLLMKLRHSLLRHVQVQLRGDETKCIIDSGAHIMSFIKERFVMIEKSEDKKKSLEKEALWMSKLLAMRK